MLYPLTLNYFLSYRVQNCIQECTHILVIDRICTLHPSACTLRFQVSGSKSRDTIFSFCYSNMVANENIITVIKIHSIWPNRVTLCLNIAFYVHCTSGSIKVSIVTSNPVRELWDFDLGYTTISAGYIFRQWPKIGYILVYNSVPGVHICSTRYDKNQFSPTDTASAKSLEVFKTLLLD